MPRGDSSFVSWGTKVASFQGEVGAEPAKRVVISQILLHLFVLPKVFKVVLRKALGLAVHPIMHCKPIFSSLHRIFKWMYELVEHIAYIWPADIRDEVIYCALLLPVSYTNIRSKSSPRTSCTDATPISGGSAETFVAQELALELFRSTEVKESNFSPVSKLSAAVMSCFAAIFKKTLLSPSWPRRMCGPPLVQIHLKVSTLTYKRRSR